jgi:hypothetical protein
MATGWSAYAANAILNAACNNTAFQVAQLYIQLHTAEPGTAGSTAIAGNEVRKAVSFGVAASGAIANDAAVQWSTSEVDTSEDYSHYSLHDASSAGNFILSGVLTANPVVTADTFELAAGDIDLSIALAT